MCQIRVQDARIQRSSGILPPESSIGSFPALASLDPFVSRKDLRSIKGNHLRLDPLDVLREGDEEAEGMEMTTIRESVMTSHLHFGNRRRIRPASPYVATNTVRATLEPHANVRLSLKIDPSVSGHSIGEDAFEMEHLQEDFIPEFQRVRSKSLNDVSRFCDESYRMTRSLVDIRELEFEMRSQVPEGYDIFSTPLHCAAEREDDRQVLCSSDFDSISKQEVVYRWKESQQKLLVTLQNVVREKRELEQRLLMMQRVAPFKPP